MPTATELHSREYWLREARREIRLARRLARDETGFYGGFWFNGTAFRHAIQRARICRTLARDPSRNYADVAYEDNIRMGRT